MAPPDGCLMIPFSVSAPWDNPEAIVSQKTRKNFGRFVNVYMLSILFLVCVPTNILNMVVFWRQGLRKRINCCLCSLAVCDLLTVLVSVLLTVDDFYSEVTRTPHKLVVTKFILNNKLNLLAALFFTSGFLSTLIAVERCLCVLHPLKAQQIIQTRTTAAIIVTGHVIITGMYYIITTQAYVVCMFDPFIGRSKDAFYTSKFFKENKTFVTLFNGVVFGILLPGLFLITTLVSTVATVLKLQQMAEWREQSSSANTSSLSKDLSLTRMLIGTSILFIVCLSPKIIVYLAMLSVPELSLSGKYYNTYLLLIHVLQAFMYINSSVNFFIYYFFGTKFRQSVQAIFCNVKLAVTLQAKQIAMET